MNTQNNTETEFVYKENTFISKEIPLEKLYDERRDVCKGCYFIDICDDVYEEGFILPPCNAGNREDNTDVVFKLKK